MIKAIIVDDEIRGVKSIEALIRTSNLPIQVIGSAQSKKEAISLIQNTKPQLVFLDIEMPPDTGFTLLDVFEKIDFKVIFVTAFQEYAIKAFKYSAVDYLMKPVSLQDFKVAVERVIDLEQQVLQLDILKNEIQGGKTSKIVLPTTEMYHILAINEIEYCRAEDNYTYFHFINGSSLLVSKSLKEYDDLLNEHQFFRVHKTFLINLMYLDRIIKRDGGFAVMRSSMEIPISMRKKTELFQVLKTLLK
jgi:two-component system LytT family response regulator